MKKVLLWVCFVVVALLLSGCSFRAYTNAASYQGSTLFQAIQETWYPIDYQSRMSKMQFVQGTKFAL